MTTVNYNDGKWHGWGKEGCPVHPESLIAFIFNYEEYDGANIVGHVWPAKEVQPWVWPSVVAFRVIKEHKEPREWWVFDGRSFSTHDGALTMAHNKPGEIIHVREVTQ